jgi:hypothetical protein
MTETSGGGLEWNRTNSEADLAPETVWSDIAVEPPLWFQALAEVQRDEISMIMSAYDQGEVAVSRRKTSDEVFTRIKVASNNIKVSVGIIMPKGYPETAPLRVVLHSSNANPQVLRQLQAELQSEANEQFELKSFALFQLVCRAVEKVGDLPLRLQSNHFGCCVKCNGRAVKANREKVFSPLRIDKETQKATCLDCGSTAIRIVGLELNIDLECSYCFCPDNPLYKVDCGCRTCLQCIQHLADVATGNDDITRDFKTKLLGIPCPNHRSATIADPALFKMCSPRVFLRYNAFTLKRAAEQLNAAVCYNPSCTGYPVIIDYHSGLMTCPHCSTCYCASCFQKAVSCQCTALVERRVDVLRIRNQLLLSAPPVKGTHVADNPIVVMLCDGKERLPFSFDPNSTSWIQEIKRVRYWLRWDFIPPVVVFAGVPLNENRPLSHYGVFSGAILFILEGWKSSGSKLVQDEIELWNFRREVAKEGTDKLESKAVAQTPWKPCPFCKKPVVHYREHGCHHIGAYGSCCGKHWCFVCFGEWPCTKCSLYCDDRCKCTECPDCRPMLPCPLCTGCSRCKTGGVTDDFR